MSRFLVSVLMVMSYVSILMVLSYACGPAYVLGICFSTQGLVACLTTPSSSSCSLRSNTTNTIGSMTRAGRQQSAAYSLRVISNGDRCCLQQYCGGCGPGRGAFGSGLFAAVSRYTPSGLCGQVSRHVTVIKENSSGDIIKRSTQNLATCSAR